MTRVNVKPIVGKWTLGAALATLLMGATALTPPAEAYPQRVWEELSPGDHTLVVEYYDPQTRMRWCVMVNEAGQLEMIFIISSGNPNPEDTSTGPGSHIDKPDVVHMIEVGDATYKVRVVPADSPELLGHLQGTAGLGPVYNPADDDNGNGPGPAPSHSAEVKLTPAEIRQRIRVENEVAATLAKLGAAMGDGDEGGTESPTGGSQHGKGGKSENDDGGYEEGRNKSIGKTEKDLLGAKPEVVNPPHWERTGASDHDHTRGGTGAGGAGGGAMPAARHTDKPAPRARRRIRPAASGHYCGIAFWNADRAARRALYSLNTGASAIAFTMIMYWIAPPSMMSAAADPLGQTMFYDTHVRGMTQLHPAIPLELPARSLMLLV